MFVVFFHVVLASIAGILLLGTITWTFLGYDSIPNLVTIEEASQKRYDYIIVGAGTAGSVLANRLSENPNTSVLLVEAGHQFGLLSAVPLLALVMQKSTVDWSYVSTVQRHSSFGMVDQRQFLPRGKGLGGSSQMNFLLHFDGADADFDAWESMAGARGWGSQTMRRYLQRIMQPANDDERPQRVFRSQPDAEGMVNVFRELRSEVEPSEPHLLFDPAASNTRNGIRWSTYHTYLRPSFGRANLDILYGTRVHRVQFDKQRRATAVLVAADDATSDRDALTIHTTREIIISAGSYATPQLLKLSGIGPRAELERFRIPVVADFPSVGNNLHEHLTVPLFVSINESISLTTDKVASVGEWWRYLSKGSGFLSRFGVVGFVADKRQNHGFGVFGAGTMEESVLRDVANCRSEVFRAEFPLYRNTSQEGFVLLNTCHQPRSRGSVELNSRNARVPPLIDPNFLAEEADVQCIRRAIRLALRMLRTRTMQRIGVQLHWPRLSGCLNFGPFAEDEQPDGEPNDRYLECVIRTIGVTAHHPGGTCAMGTDGCVDERLRVRHVNGLRVVDASILPTSISGTPNTVLMAISERAADLILDDNRPTKIHP